MNTLIIDFGDSYIENIKNTVEKIRDGEAFLVKFENFKEDLLEEVDSVILSSGIGDYELNNLLKVLEKRDLYTLGTAWSFFSMVNFFDEEILEISPKYGVRISGTFVEENSFNLDGDFTGILYDKYSVENLSKDFEKLAISKDEILSFKKEKFVGFRPHLGSYYTSISEEFLKAFFKEVVESKKEETTLYYTKEEYTGNLPYLVEELEIDHSIYWLDSSHLIEGYSRFSILGIPRPEDEEITYHVEDNFISVKSGEETREIPGSLWDYLKSKNLVRKNKKLPFDFQGGFIGVLGYGLKEDFGYPNKEQSKLPDAILQYSSSAFVVDHLEDEIYLISEKDDDFYEKLKKLMKKIASVDESFKVRRENFPKISFARNKEQYISDIKKSLDYMRAGKSLEICLTNELVIEDEIKAYEYYKILRKISPAPYGAFLEFDDFSLASSSMERFVKLDDSGRVNAKPIKGTIRRGKTEEEDIRLKEKLQKDKKSFSENIMILDLLRNDLQKVSKIDSVTVPEAMVVESYATVHQLVSTVEGELKEGLGACDLLEAVVPPGSMTGSPKKGSVDLLEELEAVPRGIYSGSVCYFSNTGAMDCNVIIRSAIIEKDQISIGVGGAIVEDSDPVEEYEEILLKAKGLLKTFEIYYFGKEISENFLGEKDEN